MDDTGSVTRPVVLSFYLLFIWSGSSLSDGVTVLCVCVFMSTITTKDYLLFNTLLCLSFYLLS